YRDAAHAALSSVQPDFVVLATGTGATQGGIIAGADASGLATRVIGVSVARSRARGEGPVAEAAVWAGSKQPRVGFTDDYVDGGYGVGSAMTDSAVALGWRYGLPLDPIYTGKAFAGLTSMIADSVIPRRARVLFWHTGGLWNAIAGTRPTRKLKG